MLCFNLMSCNTDTAPGFIPGTVPKVISSSIPTTGDGIAVTFDRPMSMTAALHQAIGVKVNGGATIHPDHVIVNPSNPAMIAFKFPAHFFHHTDVVTWAYNDQHPTEELKGAETGGKEIDNQTYGVVNNTTDPTVQGAFSDGFSEGFLI